MAPGTRYTVRVALIVALGGFLMGFDASVISGVVGFIEPEFGLSKIELGWSVASLTLTATLAMMMAGPLSDRLGRRPLLGLGLAGITVSMLLLAYGFGTATYSLSAEAIRALPATVDSGALTALAGQLFNSDVAFREAVVAAIGAEAFASHQSALVSSAISMSPTLILVGILGFVASFAISLGPVMWVLFSELFPNRVRGLAISFVGLINSSVSFLVQLVFPWELSRLGNSLTFLIYGLFAIVGLVIVMRLLPETKGRSLEELEAELVR